MKRERYKSLFDQERKEVNEDFEDEFYQEYEIEKDFDDVDTISEPDINIPSSIFDSPEIDNVSEFEDDIYQFESAPKKRVTEQTEEEKAKKAIKEIIKTDWGGSNKEQGKAVQLMRGLSFNDSDVANSFMDDLNKLTDKMDLSKYGIK